MIVIYGDGTTFVVSPLSENSDSRFGCVKMKSVVRSELSVCAADLTDPRPSFVKFYKFANYAGGAPADTRTRFKVDSTGPWREPIEGSREKSVTEEKAAAF